MELQEIPAIVCDMDGVLWRGEEALPGLVEFFEFLKVKSFPFALLTNNSRRTQVEYVAKLAKFGVENVSDRHIMTSAIATAHYLKQNYPQGTRVHIIGGNGLRYELQKAGFVIDDSDVKVVVVGVEIEFTYEKARLATRLIMDGAHFVGTNPDRTLPLEHELAPGAGSIIAMLRTATQVEPIIIGKPNRSMFDAVVHQMNMPASATLMVGDRLSTDIEGAYHAGLRTALVLTGVNNRVDANEHSVKPDFIFNNLFDLIHQWS